MKRILLAALAMSMVVGQIAARGPQPTQEAAAQASAQSAKDMAALTTRFQRAKLHTKALVRRAGNAVTRFARGTKNAVVVTVGNRKVQVASAMAAAVMLAILADQKRNGGKVCAAIASVFSKQWNKAAQTKAAGYVAGLVARFGKRAAATAAVTATTAATAATAATEAPTDLASACANAAEVASAYESNELPGAF